MTDVSEALFAAIRGALVSDATVNGYVLGRVVSDWGSETVFPMIRMSIPTLSDWEDDCGPGTEADVRIHCFVDGDEAITTRARLAHAVRDALDDTSLPLVGNELLWLDYVQTINTRDPDNPRIVQAVVRFTAVAAQST